MKLAFLKGALRGRDEIFKSKGRSPTVGGLGVLWGKLQRGSLETSGDLSPWQAVGISGTAFMQDLDPHSQPNHAAGFVTHGPEFCSKLPLFLLVGGAATFGVSWLWLWLLLSGLTRKGRVGPYF